MNKIIHITPEAHTRLKIASALSGRKMSEIASEILAKNLEKVEEGFYITFSPPEHSLAPADGVRLIEEIE